MSETHERDFAIELRDEIPYQRDTVAALLRDAADEIDRLHAEAEAARTRYLDNDRAWRRLCNEIRRGA